VVGVSIFSLPRLHFAGTAITRLPTGPRSGYVDLAVNRAITDEGAFAPERPREEFHRWLRAQGSPIDATGTITEAGPFNTVAGWNLGGNSHFWIDAGIVACELEAGSPETADPLVGRMVDLWGHHNDYLATTHNRARVFDVDPASTWSTAVMVGRLALGRAGRSHDSGYLLSGHVDGASPPRRRNTRHVRRPDGMAFQEHRRQSVVHQFVVEAGAELRWFDGDVRSPAIEALRDLVRDGAAQGLLVQFALADMAPPRAPDAPDRWRTWGTIAPWRGDELRSGPGGRLLTTRAAGHRAVLHDLSVDVAAEHVTLNAVNAVPFEHGSWTDGAYGPGELPFAETGDLVLRTAGGRVIAKLEQDVLSGPRFLRTAGVLSVARTDGRADAVDEPLVVATTDGRPVLVEEEVQVTTDDAALFLEHATHPDGSGRSAVVEVRSFVRGRPAGVRGIEVHQFPNPRAVPLDPVAGAPAARACDARIVELGPADGSGERPAERHGPLRLDTDDCGRARILVDAAQAGTTRLLLRPPGGSLPCAVDTAGSAWIAQDDDDRLGFWSAAGAVAVRVHPDHSHLAAVPDEEITFDLVFREVYATYEHLYTFMTAEIMDLADESKARTHARMIWLMCDPANRDKTYYMPSTRDMSAAQADLLRRFMIVTEGRRPHAPVLADRTATPARITSREELDAALRMAATIELSVMLQYLYAMWSLPTHTAARQLVRDGRWSERQLILVCGDGPETLDGGIRATLLGVAREEMIHFLVINNIIVATGQPFHIPAIDFTTLNSEIDVPLDMCLERFSLPALGRFVELERPSDPVRDVRRTGGPGTASGAGTRYGSLSELYASIRAALVEIPGVLMVDAGRGGGEHHLFMRRSTDVRHPDYQLEVDSLSSALFAIDFVTEHGEGNVLAPIEGIDENSHFETFVELFDVMRGEFVPGPGGRPVPWEPAYPVTRNPTLDPARPHGDLITDPHAREVVELFNRSYTLTMRMMAQHFGESPDASLRRSKLMNASLDLMVGLLRPLAEHVVTLPAGRPGRTAGPSFEVTGPMLPVARPDTALRWFTGECTQLADRIAAVADVPDEVPAILRSFARQFERDRGVGP
jgi:Ferritin-like